MDAWRRRDVLKTGIAGAAGLALLGPQAEAEKSGGNASGPFTVREGESRGRGLLTIDGKPFAAVLVASADTGGRFSSIEIHTPPGRGPELHVHEAQNEWFLVQKGNVGLQCGSEKMVLHAGDSFMAPMGVPHAFVSLGPGFSQMINLFDPAGQIEAFFVEYAATLNTPGPPDVKRLTAVNEAHGIHIVGPPLRMAEFSA